MTAALSLLVGALLGWFVGSSRVHFWKKRTEHFEAEANRLAKCVADEQFKNRHYIRVEPVIWSNVEKLVGRATYPEE